MSHARRPGLEALEDRSLPATFGLPWTDPHRLTVSFVPDGTLIGPSGTGPVTSGLFAAMDASMPRAVWQGEILRALQAWAARTGLDLVVVADSGDPMGTSGAAQGDPRFGDIRIAGAILSSGAVSTSVPFTHNAGTWAGDLLFNTAAPLGKGAEYDLFTVALHESAHALGLPEMANPSDVMFGSYTGPKTGLSAANVAAIEALYGPARPDRFEGRGLSYHQAAWETFALALNSIDEDAAPDPDLPHAVDANLTLGDVDGYAYKASGPFTVSLKVAGRSLLRGRLSVLDAGGRVVASATASGPGGDVSLSIGAAGWYTLRVEGIDDGFSSGSYRVVAKPVGTAPDPMAAMAQKMHAQLHRNDTLRAATALAPLAAPGARYSYQGRIGRTGDVDFYRLDGFTGTTLDVQAWASGSGVTVSVLDSRGRVIATGTGVLRVEGLQRNGTYFLKVSGAVGAYTLGAQAGLPAEVPDIIGSGTLSAVEPQQFRGLLLPQSSTVRLEIDLSAAKAAAAVEMALFDLDGRLVHRQVVPVGGKGEMRLYLPAGAYTIRLVAGSKDGSALLPLPFVMRTWVLSDPIGPKLKDPTAPARPTAPIWYNAPFKAVMALTDPYGRPVPFTTPPPVVFLPPVMVPRPWGS